MRMLLKIQSKENIYILISVDDFLSTHNLMCVCIINKLLNKGNLNII